MNLFRSVGLVAAALVAMTVSPGPAMARGSVMIPMAIGERVTYTGAWPVTIRHAARGNGAYCLTLKQTSRNGGSASLTGNGSDEPFGTFLILNHTLVATIQQPGQYDDAGLVFIGPASRGNIGNGVFEQVYGGENFDSGDLSFGTKGGC